MDFNLIFLALTLPLVAVTCYGWGKVDGFWQALRHPPGDELEIEPWIIWREKGPFLYKKDPGEEIGGKLISQYPEPWHYDPPVGADGDVPIGSSAIVGVKKKGRPKGTLSSASLKITDKVENLMPFIRLAQAAQKKKDGSFAQLCKETGHPESTVRGWIERYANDPDRQ